MREFRRHRGMSVEDHWRMGRAVKALEREIRRHWGSFPKTSKHGRALWSLYQAIGKHKSVLDDDICGLLPMDDHRATHFYYKEGMPELLPGERVGEEVTDG